MARFLLRHRILRVISLQDGPRGTCDHKLDAVLYSDDGDGLRYTDFGIDMEVKYGA